MPINLPRFDRSAIAAIYHDKVLSTPSYTKDIIIRILFECAGYHRSRSRASRVLVLPVVVASRAYFRHDWRSQPAVINQRLRVRVATHEDIVAGSHVNSFKDGASVEPSVEDRKSVGLTA